MAEEDTKEGITQSFTDKPEYKRDSTKWQNRKEFNVVNKVRTRMQEMRSHMKTSCPFPSPVDDIGALSTQTTSGSAMTGYMHGDYYYYLDRCDKQWIMYRQNYDDSTNLKSPMSFAPIEAAMAEFQSGNVMALLEPTQDKDTEKVKLISAAHDYLYTKAKIKEVDKKTFHDTLKYGWSIRYVGYSIRKREVTILQSPEAVEKQLDDETQRETVKENLTNNKPVTKTEVRTEYDDIGHNRVSPWEFLIDPDCKVFRDTAMGIGEASDCIWRQTASKEQVLSEFELSDDPFVKNVDKIVSADDAKGGYIDSKPFFTPAEDLNGKNQVELVRYYNKRTDKYIVIVNDVVVRDGPLPYNHKELPFVIHNLVEWEGKPLGVGICATIEGLQSEDEIMRSMMVQQLKMTIAPPLLYNKEYEEDVDAWQTYEPGQKIGFTGPVDQTVVQWMPTPQSNFGYYQMRDDFLRQSTMITGIDPIATSTPRPDEAVRTHMLSMEASQKIIQKYIANWGSGRTEAVWMDIKLMQQFYPLSYKEEFGDDDQEEDKVKDPVKKYKEIKTQGVKFNINEEDGLQIEQEYKDGGGFFELKPAYLGLAGDVDIKLDLDTMVKPSKGAMMQRSETVFPILLQAFSPQFRDVPGVSELTRWLADTHQVPARVLDSIQDTSSEQEEDDAEMENKVMAMGQKVPGTPGRSEKHIAKHLQPIFTLMAEIGAPPEQFPATPEGQAAIQKKVEEAKQKQTQLENMFQHLQTDSTPKAAATQMVMQQAQSLLQPPAPQQPPQGMGGGMPPKMAGMMQQMGGQMPPQGPQMGSPVPQGMAM